MMMEKLMNFISIVLHPLLMPTYTFILMFLFIPEMIKPLALITLPFLFVTTFIVPLLIIFMLKYFGSISDFKLKNRTERPIPFAFTAIFYSIISYMFIYKVQVNDTISAMFLSSTFLITLLAIVSTKFKISMHSAGINGVVGFLMYFGIYFPGLHITYLLMVIIIFSGISMTSRLYLHDHTPKEVLFGCFLGSTVSFLGLYIFG